MGIPGESPRDPGGSPGVPGGPPGGFPGHLFMFLDGFNVFSMENNIGLKRLAVGAMGLLQNGLEFKFRGGCDALGPGVLSILTFFDKHKK